MFIGTPHSGGQFDSAKYSALYNEAQDTLTTPIIPEKELLFDQTRDFGEIVASNGIKIRTLYEIKKTVLPRTVLSDTVSPAVEPFLVEYTLYLALPVHFTDLLTQVVAYDSAVLRIPGEKPIGLFADHVHLCRFEHSSDSSWVTTADTIQKLAELVRPKISTTLASDQPIPPGDLGSILHKNQVILDHQSVFPILQWRGYTYWGKSTFLLGNFDWI